jgi:hypothetical protein
MFTSSLHAQNTMAAAKAFSLILDSVLVSESLCRTQNAWHKYNDVYARFYFSGRVMSTPIMIVTGSFQFERVHDQIFKHWEWGDKMSTSARQDVQHCKDKSNIVLQPESLEVAIL